MPARVLTAAALLALAVGCASNETSSVSVSVPAGPPAASPRPSTLIPAPTPTPAEVSRPGQVSGEQSMPIVLHGPRTERRIALTFDADMTAAMLARLRAGTVESYVNADLIDTLRRLDVPATLVLTGLWMDTYPEVTRDLAADDLFELGTHSQTHRAFTADC